MTKKQTNSLIIKGPQNFGSIENKFLPNFHLNYVKDSYYQNNGKSSSILPQVLHFQD